MGRNDLVRTSAKAGHTQALNFFQVGPDVGKLTIVDAPGYGARGRPEWGKVFEHYLSTRKSLRRVFMLVNAKHGFSMYDEMMLQDLDKRFKEAAGLSFSYQIVLTKGDLPPVRQLSDVKNQVEQEVYKITRTWSPNVLITSAVGKGKVSGIDRLREAIVEACK